MVVPTAAVEAPSGFLIGGVGIDHISVILGECCLSLSAAMGVEQVDSRFLPGRLPRTRGPRGFLVGIPFISTADESERKLWNSDQCSTPKTLRWRKKRGQRIIEALGRQHERA